MVSIYSKQSKYQHIDLRHHPLHSGEYILYLDGCWQLDTTSEYRYHESLISIPAAAAQSITNVLICGGGDGMSVREAVKFDDLSYLDLVEIDEEMISLFSGSAASLNNNSLSNPKVKVNICDAVKFVEDKKSIYDFVVLDFPSPAAMNSQREYENLFRYGLWEKFLNSMKPTGILSAQISVVSGILVPLANKILDAGYRIWSYDTSYNKRDNHDSFIVISKYGLSQERELPKDLRFVTRKHISSALSEKQEVTRDDIEHYMLFNDVTHQYEHEYEESEGDD